MSNETFNPYQLLSIFGSRKLPIYSSTTIAECGLTCLAMIGRYHGHEMDLQTLRKRHPISGKGSNFRVLMDIATKIDLQPRAVQLEMEGLQVLKTPCILHWNRNHFVVLKKVTRKYAIIHDPSGGIQRLSLEQVSKRFTGYALELTPIDDFQPIRKDKPRIRLRDFWRHARGLKSFLVQLLALSLALQIFALLTPLYIQTVVDKVLADGDLKLLTALAIGFLLIYIIQALIGAFRGFVSQTMGISFSFQLNNNLLSHLLKLPLDFFQVRHMGDILSRFGSLESIKQFLTSNMVSVFIDGFMVISSFILMCAYSVKLTVLVFSLIALDFIIRMALFRPIRNITEKQMEASADTSSIFMETVRAITAIKIFGRETDRQQLWQNLSVEQFNQEIRLGKWNLSLGVVRQILGGLENVLVIYMAALMVMSGSFTIGMLFAFLAYKGQFTGGVSGLFDKIMQFRMLGLHLDRIADIALAEPELDSEHYREIDKDEIRGELTLKGINFRYGEGEPWVLTDFDLHIRAGESVALVGPSGCGKTTAMKVALGLLKPQDGSIQIDGLSLDQIGHKAYRGLISAVMQEDTLMSGTIGDNISFYDTDADQDWIEECATMAAIHDDIMTMPMGYMTLIGDMGSSLSGGQKQRILLARALFAKPKILFLDEATSHLDKDNELLVSIAISKLNTTRLIIAHRKETIDTADRVVDMSEDYKQMNLAE